MSEIFDELRIIAKDGKGLDTADRVVLFRAADELEQAWQQLLSTQSQLIEANAMRIALTERVIELNRYGAPPLPLKRDIA